jgi:DeoR/GlpR family transcriptional regulator of sugar metabolism
MTLNQRRTKILEMIREDGHAKVQDLCRTFNVTDVTIRQDLEILEKEGYLQREYGGAFLKDVGMFAKNITLSNQSNMSAKQELARKAVEYIKDGDSIILDSGSTTTEVAKLLTDYKNLNVITNSLNIALILGENPGINLIVTGGEFKAPTLSLTGQKAADFFFNIHVSKLFLATAGITPDLGLTYPSISDLVVKQAMIDSSDTIYLVADTSKIGICAFANLGPVSLIDYFITDSSITPEQKKLLEDSDIHVI